MEEIIEAAPNIQLGEMPRHSSAEHSQELDEVQGRKKRKQHHPV